MNTIVIDNKNIVAITVPASKETVFGNGMALKRVGGRNQPLSAQEIVQKVTAPADAGEIRKLADAISRQTQTIERQTDMIDELKAKSEEANSFGSKFKEYLISGVIGAVIGVILTKVLGG